MRIPGHHPLYTPAERARRDATPWTMVQAILAPVQFVIFLGSLTLVLRYLGTGRGLVWAEGSLVLKAAALLAIMGTGCLWERAVFGRYLFARAFFWEDVIGIGVVALHLSALAAWAFDLCPPAGVMALTLLAYAGYVLNAGQFVLKLRRARLSGRSA